MTNEIVGKVGNKRTNGEILLLSPQGILEKLFKYIFYLYPEATLQQLIINVTKVSVTAAIKDVASVPRGGHYLHNYIDTPNA